MSRNVVIPNSYQTPNEVVDRVYQYLLPEEIVVLNYAIRHILGWRDKIADRRGNISLSMFECGFTTKDGTYYGGCWLARPKISRALKSLVEYGVIAKVGAATQDGQEWALTFDDPDAIKWDDLQERRANIDALSASRVSKATTASAKKRKRDDGSTTAVPPSEVVRQPYQQYDSRTAGSTTVVHNQTYSNPSIKDSDTPNGGQGGASAPAEQWGYKIGQIAYWWYEDGQKWVPGVITKFSPQYVYFESKDKNGAIHEVKRGRKKCSPDGRTDDWKLVSELEPIHRLIAIRSYHMELDQAVDGGRMTELNTHVKDLRVRFGTNGNMVTESELNAAYGWQKSQGITSPKKRGAIGDMIGAYRESDMSRKVTTLKVHFPAAGRACDTCGGTGQLLGVDNAAVPCPECLKAENGDGDNELAA